MVSEYDAESDINDWLSIMEDSILAKYGKVSDERVIATLRTFIGKLNLPIVKQLIENLPEDDRTIYVKVKQSLINHFKPRTNLIIERNFFYNMTQDEGEKADDYMQRLRTQVAKCRFDGKIDEEMIRDRLVVGLFDNGIRERLFREDELTLKSALDIIRAIEVAAIQQRKLQETVVIHKLKADKRRKDKEEPQIGFGGSLKLGCKRCGYKHGIRNCPAFGKRCHKCNEKGHVMKMCAKWINQIAYEEEQEDVL